MPKAAMKTILRMGSWHEWARTLPGVTEVEIAMSKGPRLDFSVSHRMHYQGQTFCTKAAEYANKKSVDSLVMTWFVIPSPQGSHLPPRREPYIGRAQAFYTIVPPWAVGSQAEQQQEAMHIVDAKWYPVVGKNSNIYNAPIVQNKTKPEAQGDFWRCDKLVPVPIGLGEYFGTAIAGHSSANLYQVVTREVATFKPDIDDV